MTESAPDEADERIGEIEDAVRYRTHIHQRGGEDEEGDGEDGEIVEPAQHLKREQFRRNRLPAPPWSDEHRKAGEADRDRDGNAQCEQDDHQA